MNLLWEYKKESFTKHLLLPQKASLTSIFCTLYLSPKQPKAQALRVSFILACDGAQNTELGGTVLAHPHKHQLVKSLRRQAGVSLRA